MILNETYLNLEVFDSCTKGYQILSFYQIFNVKEMYFLDYQIKTVKTIDLITLKNLIKIQKINFLLFVATNVQKNFIQVYS